MWSLAVPPLGLSYIDECLSRAGFVVSVRDYNVILHKKFIQDKGLKAAGLNDIWNGGYALEWEMDNTFLQNILPQVKDYLVFAVSDILDWVKNEQLEAIGFSLFGTNSHATRFVCYQLKKANPKLKLFVGGAQTFNYPWRHEVLNGLVDACVTGKGEISCVELIKAWSQNDFESPIDGVLRRGSNRDFIPYRPRPLLNLADLPVVSHGKLYDWGQIPIQMSRGCVALCSFCDQVRFWEKFRYRKPEDIFEEMKSNSERLGIKLFLVMDSLLNGHHKNFVILAQLLKDANLGILYGGNSRIDKRLTKDVIQLLRESGCVHLTFGLESGSQRILDKMRKGIRLEWAVYNLKLCTETGIAVNLNLIAGFPGEEEEDFDLTIKFLKDNRHNYTSVSTGMGMGIGMHTEVFDRPKKYGIRTNPDGSVWYGPEGRETEDGRNNLAVRMNRLKKVRAMLKNYDITYWPAE